MDFSNYTQNQDNHEVQLFLLSIIQQPMETCHQLVRLSPDNLLAYLTQLRKLVIVSVLLQKLFYYSYKYLHFQHLSVIACFSQDPPCADVIALFWLMEEKFTIVSKQVYQDYLHN